MTVEELCRLLVSGSVGDEDVPELADEDVRDEVRERLAGAGCDLAYSAGTRRWIARLDGPLPPVESHSAILSLHKAELAVLAACWLHMRFLPQERAKVEVREEDQLLAAPDADGQPTIAVDDLLAQFHGKLNKGYLENIVLGHLKNAGFLRQHGGRLSAGPLLDTLDEVAAGEHARRLLARHQRMAYLRRRAEAIVSDATAGPGEADG